MAAVYSTRYPHLVVADLGMVFVDGGPVEIDDPRTLELIARIDGIEIHDAPDAPAPTRDPAPALAADEAQADTDAAAATSVPEGTPSDEWTVAALVAYADEAGIGLGQSRKKADVLAAIAAAEQ